MPNTKRPLSVGALNGLNSRITFDDLLINNKYNPEVLNSARKIKLECLSCHEEIIETISNANDKSVCENCQRKRKESHNELKVNLPKDPKKVSLHRCFGCDKHHSFQMLYGALLCKSCLNVLQKKNARAKQR